MMNQHFMLVLSAVQLILASGQADTELKSSCLLQTGAAREQPLAMSHGEDVGSRPEYLRNALVMVRELASNVTAWDTDLSQSERTSLDLIKAFIADLFTSAVNSHDEDQKEVNRAKDLIAWCASTAATSLTNDVGPLKSTMEGSRQDHNGCRTSEGGCQVHQNQACAAWEAYRKSNTPNNCVSVDFKDHMGTTVESTKLDMEQCLRDLRPYYLKHIPCWQYKECVDGYAPLCDKNQTKFERDYCSYSSQLTQTCDAQIDCRKKHIAFRDDTHTDVGVNEAARKADYATGKKILCYFKVFEANNPNKSAILRDCDKLAVDTSKLDIAYPGTPAPNPCVVEDKEPCKNGWEDVEYKNKKWVNDVTLLDCTPCPAPTTGAEEMDDDCSGWSANLHHVVDGKCYMGAFDNRNRRITKTFSGLQAGCTYKWKAVIDTWASVDNEKMILTVNGAATNVKTRGAGDCNNGWTPYAHDFGDKVGSHGSSNGGWKDCWKNFEKEFVVPDSGNADVDMYFEIDQGISDEGWGWHDMTFKKVSCPGAMQKLASGALPSAGGGSAGTTSYTSPNGWTISSDKPTYNNGNLYWLSNAIDGSDPCQPSTCSERDTRYGPTSNAYWLAGSSSTRRCAGSSWLEVKMDAARYIDHVVLQPFYRQDSTLTHFRVLADDTDVTPAGFDDQLASYFAGTKGKMFESPPRGAACEKYFRVDVKKIVQGIKLAELTSSNYCGFGEIMLVGEM